MAILVEFYGVPRIRAGVDRLAVLDGRTPASLGDVLREVAKALPDFAKVCLDDDKLRDNFIASINGELFAPDEDTMVLDNQSVLLLSADAGG